MTAVASVCAWWANSTAYPCIFPSDSRNAGWDYQIVDEYAFRGTSADLLPAQGWSSYRRRGNTLARPTDVVAVGYHGVLVSTRLKALLQDVAPNDLAFRACTVDGKPFWMMRVVTERDAAIDAKASGLRLGPDGQMTKKKSFVWRRSELAGAAMFRTTQIQSRIWVTDTVAIACMASGYPGMSIAGPYGEIRDT